jgi:hypothetical protein
MMDQAPTSAQLSLRKDAAATRRQGRNRDDE